MKNFTQCKIIHVLYNHLEIDVSFAHLRDLLCWIYQQSSKYGYMVAIIQKFQQNVQSKTLLHQIIQLVKDLNGCLELTLLLSNGEFVVLSV